MASKWKYLFDKAVEEIIKYILGVALPLGLMATGLAIIGIGVWQAVSHPMFWGPISAFFVTGGFVRLLEKRAQTKEAKRQAEIEQKKREEQRAIQAAQQAEEDFRTRVRKVYENCSRVELGQPINPTGRQLRDEVNEVRLALSKRGIPVVKLCEDDVLSFSIWYGYLRAFKDNGYESLDEWRDLSEYNLDTTVSSLLTAHNTIKRLNKIISYAFHNL